MCLLESFNNSFEQSGFKLILYMVKSNFHYMYYNLAMLCHHGDGVNNHTFCSCNFISKLGVQFQNHASRFKTLDTF